jgi:NAD(P)-dependent dehydrogenase (short-subunit alcohol dehydrogenase family)
MGLVDDKVVLVTGAGSGIGRASALLFGAEGARGVIASDVNADAVHETLELLRDSGADAIATVTDIAVASQVEAMIATCVERYGRLDCAHNNAGIAGEPARTADCTEENWRRVLDVMLTGTWLCVKHEIRQMIMQGGGAIVNTASTVGFTANAGLPAYVAAKHGILGLTKAAALDHLGDNVRVNAICPGATLTGMMLGNSGATPDALEAIAAAQPGGRIASPDEQAEAAVWLCSPRASFITGAALTVDNGATLGGTVSHTERANGRSVR